MNSSFFFVWKMVQALICSQDWLRAPKGVSIVDVEENLKDMEEIEKGINKLFAYSNTIPYSLS